MKVVCLLSGGIDSPVAAYLIGRNGAEVILLHMDNRPYADDSAFQKAVALSNRLSVVMGVPMPLYVAPHGTSQTMIEKRCKKNLQCVLCKRTMLKVARNVAIVHGAKAVVTGESLGQVASQTLYNIGAEQSGLDFLVLRPLIGLDKLKIEKIAKEIGTYEISIAQGRPCTILPNRPATMASPEMIWEQEKCLDIEQVARDAASKATRVNTDSSSDT